MDDASHAASPASTHIASGKDDSGGGCAPPPSAPTTTIDCFVVGPTPQDPWVPPPGDSLVSLLLTALVTHRLAAVPPARGPRGSPAARVAVTVSRATGRVLRPQDRDRDPGDPVVEVVVHGGSPTPPEVGAPGPAVIVVLWGAAEATPEQVDRLRACIEGGGWGRRPAAVGAGLGAGTGPSLWPAWLRARLSAYKLLKSSKFSEKSLRSLISTVVETACATDNQGPGSHNLSRVDAFLQERRFPCDGSIDIAGMEPIMVQSLLPLLPKERVEEYALMTWIKVGNWPAAKELIVSNSFLDSSVSLSSMSLDCIPDQLEGLSCEELDLSFNNIREIPEWFYHVRARQVNLLGNPVSPSNLVVDTWHSPKFSRLIGEKPELTAGPSRIVLLGGPRPGKAAFLKCLMENKTKTTVKTGFMGPSKVIKVHKPFKLRGTDARYTAWELGGENDEFWNPFYPCFFFADSIFILIFDGSAVNPSGLPKCLIPAGKPKVIPVGIYTDTERDLPFFKELFPSIIKDWGHRIHFCRCFGVNLASGEGFATNSTNDPTVNVEPRVMALIGQAITNTEFDEEKWAVPPSWFQLHEVMVTHKEEVITWSQFIKFAHENGVGRPEVQNSSTNIPLDKEFLAIRGCVDYLSDMGDIFHFWHSAFSFIRDGSHTRDQIIVLKPSWFNETMTSIINQLNPKFTDGICLLSQLSPSAAKHNPSPSEVVINQKAIVQVLNPMAKLGMMMTISSKPFLSFSLLPNTSQNGRKTFWSTTAIKNGKMVACGRHLDFGFLPVELFSRVMSSMCNIPGVEEPILFWQTGLLIYRFLKPDNKDHMYYLLMTLTEDSVTGTTQVDILVKSVCSANKEITWKDSLMIPAINFLHQIAESNVQNPVVVQSFPCPQCVLTSSSHPSFFSQEEIIKAALDKTKQLVCKTHATQQLSSVAPDLFNLGFPVILADTIMEANSTAPTVTRSKSPPQWEEDTERGHRTECDSGTSQCC
ncbi:hypothetical protein Pelo_7240 [Pelomyxa schiedti]|nr:hypothetical protein Pelo_7240 [Pelomyxa schiedti]